MMSSSRKPAGRVRSGVRERTVEFREGRQGRFRLLQANFCFLIGACANGSVNTPLATFALLSSKSNNSYAKLR